MFLNFDEAGAEWHVVAFLCRDPAMLEISRARRSPHVITAKRMFGLDEETILAEEKLNGKLNDPEAIATNRKSFDLSAAKFIPRTMSFRQAAKKSAHGLNYDEGPKVFALQNEIDERDAKRLIHLYKNVAYPGIPKWHASVDAQIRKTRVLENCFGRRCYFMGQINRDTFKQGYAFIPQSTVADACTDAMVKAFDDVSPEFAPAELLAQVHDSLLFQYLRRDFAAMARFAIRLGRDYMRPVLRYHDEEFQLDVELKVGLDWARMSEIKGFMEMDEETLAEKLREAYDTLRSNIQVKAAVKAA